jgi:hypothetical protein
MDTINEQNNLTQKDTITFSTWSPKINFLFKLYTYIVGISILLFIFMIFVDNVYSATAWQGATSAISTVLVFVVIIAFFSMKTRRYSLSGIFPFVIGVCFFSILVLFSSEGVKYILAN